MSKKDKINLVLYWHMHQPEYRDLRNGEYCLPWTYLHTIKDYVDMAAHLEDVPGARAVVNFAPVLLEQIEDYSRQLNGYLYHGRALSDPLLRALAEPVISKQPEKRLTLIKDCLRANEQRLINRFDHFKVLADMAKAILKTPEIIHYYDDQFIADLLVWYHLSWMAETERRKDKRIKALMDKGSLYSIHDRRVMIEIIHGMTSTVIDRYKKLALDNRIELSMTPYAHPIVPLLLDMESTRDAMPDAPLPGLTKYPGGEQRSEWHMQKGLETFQRIFGFSPQGCWPSEGSISGETVELISNSDIRWLASGETVLRNSLAASNLGTDNCIHTAYQYKDNKSVCFFRDDGLSDLIGFKYSDWHADDAVGNLIVNIKNIANACKGDPKGIVSIILDGENAWEYYPENGYHFLSALYKQLAEHEEINLTTYGEYLDQQSETISLSNIVAGSWVYGSFSTWIGEQDKNRAWDMLTDAKHVYDQVMATDKLNQEDRQRAEMQLAICEGSDWFWWFGDYNPSDSVEAFDEQYRMHLCNLYSILGREAPEYLSHAFSHGSGAPAMGGVMLPGKQN
ncbi:MAG: glycoside hydrolase [Gammaproteobacteria bacterium]|nr:glycoside hydrolase [Gammaproteobacteria bacterium]MBT3723243.1 glycoside hydrolase [Gammaproteobacteria bacterium]MBT4078843.1 glycoside hydrolase [Gammaproteobacteria bacterium]MBT4196491.1 glycoside hydrolase [Gammaproteobacteria bacterium]MBT4450177.1 glycoside hydrolase [Gammaproteobacteria bacterium]